MTLESKSLVGAIRRKRESEGLSIRALASIVGVSFSTLARIERGDGAPDNNSQIRLLEWLGDDARHSGLTYENVAYVHFRASKNARSKTIQCLLRAAEDIKASRGQSHIPDEADSDPKHFEPWSTSMMLSKQEMEDIASEFRDNLELREDEPFDSLNLSIEGIDVLTPTEVHGLPNHCLSYLQFDGCDDWSAMSVPLEVSGDRWAVLMNDRHIVERQRVTLLEECWHILLGHKLTRIAKISGSFGRTYESIEEHDAFYLAAATLLPRSAMVEAVEKGTSATELATRFGVSSQLVDYRIKRLSLWKSHRKLDLKKVIPSV